MDDRAADGARQDPRPREGARWHRYVLAPTLLLVAVALGALPFVLASMVVEVRGDQTALYDLRDGRPIGPGQKVNPGGAEYLNVAVVDLNEATGSLTLAISGNRSCNPCASPKQMTFFALDADVAQRRGITPFATVTVPAGEKIYSQRVTLPVRGSPIRYPFDAYQLRLGLDLPPPESPSTNPGPAATPVGTPTAGPSSGANPTSGTVLGTLESQLTRFVMDTPTLVAAGPPTTQAAATPAQVYNLTFHRPAYLPALATLLVVFVAVSSGLALATQPIDGLLLGLGGLILAIWGVRSVLVPSWLEAITAVDLALSGVILLLLIGVAVRAALHLHRRAGIHLPRLRRR